MSDGPGMNNAVPRSSEEQSRRVFRREREACQRSSGASEGRRDFLGLEKDRGPGQKLPGEKKNFKRDFFSHADMIISAPTSSTILRAVAVLSAM